MTLSQVETRYTPQNMFRVLKEVSSSNINFTKAIVILPSASQLRKKAINTKFQKKICFYEKMKPYQQHHLQVRKKKKS
jgi:hypothetical protein